MGAAFLLYVLVLVLLGLAAFQFTAWARRKRLGRSRHVPPPGFESSDEIFIDPTTGVRQRVWYNSKTGERYYENLERGDDL